MFTNKLGVEIGKEKAFRKRIGKSIYAKQIALFVCKFLLISQRLKSWYCEMGNIDYLPTINDKPSELFNHELLNVTFIKNTRQ